MPSIKVTFKPPIEKVGKAISDVKVKSFLRDEINKLAFSIQRYSKQFTPVGLTGFLRARQPVTRATASRLTAEIEAIMEYAIYVHEGTRYMRGRPFMVKGVEYGTRSLEEDIPRKLEEEFTKRFKKL